MKKVLVIAMLAIAGCDSPIDSNRQAMFKSIDKLDSMVLGSVLLPDTILGKLNDTNSCRFYRKGRMYSVQLIK